MNNSVAGRLSLLENILDRLQIYVTYLDAESTVVYRNKMAADRPTAPRWPGMNIRDCHNEKSNKIIDRILKNFRKGRHEPHVRIIQG